MAIHLDAQQRLVLARAGTYCAEPSPDALASFAAGLGLRLGKIGKRSAAFENVLQSSAASIGLRTQSITLMRDALYRVCEATANGVVGKVGAATLLARSQDLTAVVLAIEQLTGAVAPDPVILTSETTVSSSEILMANQELLEAAEMDVSQKLEALVEAREKRDELKKTVKAKEEAVEKAQPNSDNVEDAKRELGDEKSKLDRAERKVELQEKLHEEAVRNRDTIRDIRESALTRGIATASGFGEFGRAPIQRTQLDAQTTERVAAAIEEMVTQVLEKRYTLESCTALITDAKPPETNPQDSKAAQQYAKVRQACTDLVFERVNRETQMVRALQYSELDAVGRKILAKVTAIPNLRQKMNDWLESYGVKLTTVLYGGHEFLDIRNALADQFSDQLQ